MGISKEYAAALFALAAESGDEDRINEGLIFVRGVFKKTPELFSFLSSPGIRKDERLRVLAGAFEEEIPEYVTSFLCLLCERREIDYLFEIIEEFFKLYKQSRNRAHALIYSATELTSDEKARLIAKLEQTSGKKVDAEYIIDAGLLGGITVEMDGTVIDGSLRHNLETMKEVMIS